MHIYVKNKKLILNDYKAKCSIGKRGIGVKKKEGDLVTPKGKFKIKFILYRVDRVPKLKTTLKKIIIRKNMGWCDDPKSKYYNKLIKFPFRYSAEKLYKKNNTYDIILVLSFNSNPVRKYKGSAIFIHLATKDYKNTAGCIGIKKKDMKKIIPKIKKNSLAIIN